MLTHENVKKFLRYDEDSGRFFWREKPAKKIVVGSVAGYLRPDGYIAVRLHGEKHVAHRLAWFYVYGNWPTLPLDHVNGDRSDNRMSNLRLATVSQNLLNKGANAQNTSGYKGVTFDKRRGVWKAQAQLHGKRYNLGGFKIVEDAAAAYRAFAITHHGEFYYDKGLSRQ